MDLVRLCSSQDGWKMEVHVHVVRLAHGLWTSAAVCPTSQSTTAADQEEEMACMSMIERLVSRSRWRRTIAGGGEVSREGVCGVDYVVADLSHASKFVKGLVVSFWSHDFRASA